MTPSEEPKLLSVKEVAGMLGISQRTVWSMTNAGEIPCVRIRKRVLYRFSHIQHYIEKKTSGVL